MLLFSFFSCVLFLSFFFFFFFFQAEDGIRDGHVTGVQTCALPISLISLEFLNSASPLKTTTLLPFKSWLTPPDILSQTDCFQVTSCFISTSMEIGRASCRERV